MRYQVSENGVDLEIMQPLYIRRFLCYAFTILYNNETQLNTECNNCIAKAYPCLLCFRWSEFKRWWRVRSGYSLLKVVFRKVRRKERWEDVRRLRTTLRHDGGDW